MKVKISEIKPNPSNPRIIKDDKFKKLVKSIKEFPEMLAVREIVVDENMIVLGGNMRLKALREAGVNEVEVKQVDWTEEQKKEFLIKDNLGYGEWSWEDLENDWDSEQLEDWGLDLPDWDNEKNEFDDSIYNDIEGVDIPDIGDKLIRGLQIPIKYEDYDMVFQEFQKALKNKINVGIIFYNSIKHENDRIMRGE